MQCAELDLKTTKSRCHFSLCILLIADVGNDLRLNLCASALHCLTHVLV